MLKPIIIGSVCSLLHSLSCRTTAKLAFNQPKWFYNKKKSHMDCWLFSKAADVETKACSVYEELLMIPHTDKYTVHRPWSTVHVLPLILFIKYIIIIIEYNNVILYCCIVLLFSIYCTGCESPEEQQESDYYCSDRSCKYILTVLCLIETNHNLYSIQYSNMLSHKEIHSKVVIMT